jgi:hypothetical protein
MSSGRLSTNKVFQLGRVDVGLTNAYLKTKFAICHSVYALHKAPDLRGFLEGITNLGFRIMLENISIRLLLKDVPSYI